MNQSLKRARNTLGNLEEKVSFLKDEVVATSVHHFEMEKRYDIFIYLGLNLTPIYYFQVVRNRQLMDEE